MNIWKCIICFQWGKKDAETKDQFLIDKMVLIGCKKIHTNLGMTWINYSKAYDMILELN